MLSIRIRPMKEEDLEIVAELAMLANPFAEKESYKRHILDELKQNPELSIVAVNENDEVIGYAQAEVHGKMAVLEDIAVSQKWQGKGIGKMLLKKEVETLKQKGVKIVVAEVHYKCASAIPFYYKFGFRISGRTRPFWNRSRRNHIKTATMNENENN